MESVELSSSPSPIDYFGIWSFDRLGGTGAPKDPDERPSDRAAVDVVFDLNKNLEVHRSIVQLSGTPVASGGFGTIRRGALHQQSGDDIPVAVKKLRPVKTQRIRLAREIKIWAELRHPNILPLIGYYWDEPTAEAWLISPFCEDGNVRQYLSTGQRTMEQRLSLLMDTTNGLQYLHGQDIPVCHGDLKIDNVLVNHRQGAMLCDFGLARLWRDPADHTGLTTNQSQKGSVRYYSPELAHPKTSDQSLPTLQSDMWAWGCLVLEITTSKTPFPGCFNIGAVYIALSRGEVPEDLSKLELPHSIKGVLEACWQLDSTSRPSINECKSVLNNIIAAWRTTPDLSSPISLGLGEARAPPFREEGRLNTQHDGGRAWPSVPSVQHRSASSPLPDHNGAPLLRHPRRADTAPGVMRRMLTTISRWLPGHSDKSKKGATSGIGEEARRSSDVAHGVPST